MLVALLAVLRPLAWTPAIPVFIGSPALRCSFSQPAGWLVTQDRRLQPLLAGAGLGALGPARKLGLLQGFGQP